MEEDQQDEAGQDNRFDQGALNTVERLARERRGVGHDSELDTGRELSLKSRKLGLDPIGCLDGVGISAFGDLDAQGGLTIYQRELGLLLVGIDDGRDVPEVDWPTGAVGDHEV